MSFEQKLRPTEKWLQKVFDKYFLKGTMLFDVEQVPPPRGGGQMFYQKIWHPKLHVQNLMKVFQTDAFESKPLLSPPL